MEALRHTVERNPRSRQPNGIRWEARSNTPFPCAGTDAGLPEGPLGRAPCVRRLDGIQGWDKPRNVSHQVVGSQEQKASPWHREVCLTLCSLHEDSGQKYEVSRGSLEISLCSNMTTFPRVSKMLNNFNIMH